MKTIFGLVLVSAYAAAAFSGSLTPPGAPAPTMKTLDEVEARTPIHGADLPLTISQPGSYYLAENIDFSGAGNGITINAANVTLDLNGFTLKGPGPGGGPADGIRALQEATTGTVVRNGIVSDWPSRGISLSGNACYAEKISVRQNGGEGMQIRNGSVIDCTAEFNAGSGIICFGTGGGTQNIVSGCKAANNGNHGIQLLAPGLVKNNTCTANTENGIFIGISAAGSAAENNVCTENTVDGIRLAAPNCAVNNNNCSENEGAGIHAISAPNASLNNNDCSANIVNGIRVAFSSTGCAVKNNHCSANGDDGIVLDSNATGCTAQDNLCSANGSDGIFVDADDCRVEGNNLSGNTATGLRMNAASIAMRNTAGGNGFNYTLNSQVIHGPIITLSAGSDILSEHPWANFGY